MNSKASKQLRKSVYKDLSLRTERVYTTEDNGSQVCSGKRREYQLAKRMVKKVVHSKEKLAKNRK